MGVPRKLIIHDLYFEGFEIVELLLFDLSGNMQGKWAIYEERGNLLAEERRI